MAVQSTQPGSYRHLMLKPKQITDRQTASLRERMSNLPFLHYRPVIMLICIAREMLTRDANHLAAGVSYYAIFALFPCILGVIVLSDFLFESDILQKAFLEFIIGNLPGSSGFIQSNLDRIIEQRSALAVIAVIGLLWASGAFFEAITRVVNRAWGIHRARPFHISRLRHLISLAFFGFILMLSVAVSSLLEILQQQDLGIPGQRIFLEPGMGKLVLQLTSWLVTFIIFLSIYRFVPNCRVYWRHVWLGSVAATVFFETAKVLFTWYLTNYANYNEVYGSLASVIVFLFWVYVAAIILILGAEICSQYQSIYRPDDLDEQPSGWG